MMNATHRVQAADKTNFEGTANLFNINNNNGGNLPKLDEDDDLA